MTKPFAPKLGTARPRVSAALNQAALGQFEPQAVPNQAPPKKKKQSQRNQVSMALMGQF